MSQDPWKKAYRMSKQSRRQADSGRPRRPGRPTAWPLVVALIVGLPLIAGVGMFWYAWQNRGALLPQYEEKLPEQVIQNIDIPRRQVDLLKLDQGLGISLAIFGSQGELVRTTREWGIEWKLIALGSDRFRLETAGLQLTAAGDVIESWELDVEEVFGNELWEPWREELRNANVDPQLNLREQRGDPELHPGTTIIEQQGPTSLQYSGNWRHPAYELEFRDGWLREIRAGMAIGAATDDDPEDG